MEEPDVEDFHKHTFYEIIWVDEGVCKQVIDYQSYEVSSQTLFFISPGQLHEFEEWQRAAGGSILFTEDFFLLNQQDKNKLFEMSFLDNFYGNPYLKPDPKSYVEIRQTIELLATERKRRDASQPIQQALLHILLSQIQRGIDSQAKEILPKKYTILYKRFKRLIDEHFQTSLTAGDYAARLHITQHHLNYLTKRVTGKTASAVIRARSVLEAKRLLTFTDFTVTEIASQLGFFDSSYFAKLFKSDTGVAPGEFKKSISEKYRIR
ncbi:MAG: helix-turn-helix transcriptional regulator [Ferruginibacter sp.]|nr:helix-turn-helix transcriptional regulator [Cytophagales bacterium]